MKRFAGFLFFVSVIIPSLCAQGTLDYYLPEDVTYNPDIPTPAEVIGHEVGELHVRHDKLVEYMRQVAEISDRVTIEQYAETFEKRPLLYVIFSAPENIERLEELRKKHLNWLNPEYPDQTDVREIPGVILLGYSVHGNEPSGGNSSLLTAYYLAAAEGEKVQKLLKNNIIIVDPCLNPDGFDRFASWVNRNKSLVPATDPISDEFNEPWPGGRTNHYWFDLNRDYLLLVNPESRGRIKMFHKWQPGIVTDHHEMGSNSTFFFQPGIPTRNNPLIPGLNNKLTHEIAAYHARNLDNIGSLYYSEESFDDFYLGKASAYPDVNGGIGILFEQGSSRGLKRETINGLLTFPFTIRNQFKVTLSTLDAAEDMHDQLLQYQKAFFKEGLMEAEKYPTKGFLFGDAFDHSKNEAFLRILKYHDIRYYPLAKPWNSENRHFIPGAAYVVPMKQKQFRMVRTLFEKDLTFSDSTFYDVSTWTFPLAFDMPVAEIKDNRTLTNLMGKNENKKTAGGVLAGEKAKYGYLFEWNETTGPALLYALLDRGLHVRVANQTFQSEVNGQLRNFSRGTIFVPVGNQPSSPDSIFRWMDDLSRKTGIAVYGISTGLTSRGMDMGSRNMVPVTKPAILMFTGSGVSSRDAGEIWHLLDTQYHIPVTRVDVSRASRLQLHKYNVIIFPGGSYRQLSEEFIRNLREWVSEGGTIIAIKDANRWLSSVKLAGYSMERIQEPPAEEGVSYDQRWKQRSLEYLAGAIFEATLDVTHPLAFGYTDPQIPLFKTQTLTVDQTKPGTFVPARYTITPLLSGYASAHNIENIAGSPAIVTTSLGSGRIISYVDDINFRGYWFGARKLFLNGIMFRELIR